MAIAKTKELRTGDLIGSEEQDHELWLDTLQPVFGLVLSAQKQKDEMKLGEALHALIEDDPSLALHHDPDTQEVVLRGRG